MFMVQLNQVSHQIFKLENTGNIAYEKLFLLTNEEVSTEAQSLRRLLIVLHGLPLESLNVLLFPSSSFFSF